MQKPRREETEQKVNLALEALRQLAQNKQKQSAWGQVSVKLIWEDGFLKMVEISDTTTIKDLPGPATPPAPQSEVDTVPIHELRALKGRHGK